MSNQYSTIPIIDRASNILREVINSSDGIQAKKLYHESNIPKTTFYRLLASMVKNDLLEYHSDTGEYTIGRLLASVYNTRDSKVWQMREIAMPLMKELSQCTGETAKLAVISGTYAYTIATAEADMPMRVSINPGSIFPMHASAAGKILMSNFSEDDLQHYGECCETLGIRYTEKTILTIEALRQELQVTREQGYAIDKGEFIGEIQAVAAPVLNSAGQIVAAISIVYPVFKEERVEIKYLVSEINKTAKKIMDKVKNDGFSQIPAQLIVE